VGKRTWLLGLALVLSAPAWAGDAPSMAAAPNWVQEDAVPTAGAGSGGLRYELVSDQVDLTGTQPRWYRRVSYTVQRDGALADAGQIGIGYQPDYQSMALNHLEVWRDGRRLDLRQRAHYARLRRESDLESGLLDGSLTVNISLPDLRVGDRIDYGFTITGDNPVFGHGYYDSYGARYDVPLAARRVRVRYPDGLPLRWNVSTAGFRQTQVHRDGVAELLLEADALPAVNTEKDTPEGFDDHGRIELSTAADWRAVSDWAVTLYPHGFRDAAMARAIAAQLRLDPADPQASMLRAIAFVQGDIRYLGLEMGANSHAPHTPEQTLRLRYGDCKDKATLLVALLGLAGIEAEPVLVNSAPGMDLSTRLPSPLAFDHVVVRAQPQSAAAVWIDATRDRELGELDARAPLPFGQGLPVRAGQSQLVSLPYPRAKAPEVAVAEEVVLAVRPQRRNAVFRVATEYRNGLGDNARDMFEREGADAVGQHYLDYMRGFYTALQQVEPPTLEGADPERLRIHEQYRLEWPAKEGDLVGFPLFQLQDWMKELPRTERRTPLALAGPRLATHTVRVRSDGGLSVRARTDEIANPWFRFSRRIEMSDGDVVITGRWERLALQIPPRGLRRAARDMDRARELLYFEHDFKADPWGQVGVRPWLFALAGLLATAVLLLAAAWSWRSGGIGGMLYTPRATGARLGQSRSLRVQAWLVLAVACAGATLICGRPTLLSTALVLASSLACLLLFVLVMWGLLRAAGVPIGVRPLAQAMVAAQAPQLPFLVGMALALTGSAAWAASGGALQPQDVPALLVVMMLLPFAAGWTWVSLWLGVAGAAAASRRRIGVATIVLAGLASLLMFAAGVAVYLLRRGGS